VDISNIILAIVAIFSAMFVVVTEGTSQTLGYRGSEQTVNRKKRIDTALDGLIKKEMSAFVRECQSRKVEDEEEMQKKFENLGYQRFVTWHLTANILDSVTDFTERGIARLIAATIALFITSLVSLTLDLSQWTALLIFLAYASITAFIYWLGISCFRNSYTLKKKFILLDEKATLENAVEVSEELIDRELV
jgi:membrane protein implicated in regulation of membrane protease activity